MHSTVTHRADLRQSCAVEARRVIQLRRQMPWIRPREHRFIRKVFQSTEVIFSVGLKFSAVSRPFHLLKIPISVMDHTD